MVLERKMKKSENFTTTTIDGRQIYLKNGSGEL